MYTCIVLKPQSRRIVDTMPSKHYARCAMPKQKVHPYAPCWKMQESIA
jgi:hypothetical protein